MRPDSFFSGALCVMSGGRLPAALFLVLLLDSKGAKAVALFDFVVAKCFWIPYLKLAYSLFGGLRTGNFLFSHSMAGCGGKYPG